MKKLSLTLILITIVLMSFSIKGEEPNWFTKLKQIKPLKSSRQDVEKIFDNYKIKTSFIDNGLEWIFYEMPEGKLSVRYSIGKCSTEKMESYDVEKNVVIDIVFFADTQIKFSKFNINKKQLHKTRDEDDPALHYVNNELGVDYIVQRGKVDSVKFYPSSDMKNLKCKPNT